MELILILLAVIAFIVIATTKFKLHPFLALISAAFLVRLRLWITRGKHR